MKIALFGGTGRVGRAFLEQALNEGHNVRLLVRDPSKIENIDKNAEMIKGNARNLQSIEKTVSGCDAVVSCLGTDGDDTLTVAVPLIVQAIKNENINRVITIGTAGILQAKSNPDLYRFQSNESKRTLTRAANEHLNVYQTLKESNLQWTIVCPTYLPDGELTKKYRFEENYLPEHGKQISAEDTGYFTYQVLIEKSFIRKRVGLAY
ncbi:NAD(P)-dependent oxidoreductase [Peribacillus frigoritolerans]|uniref:NAD(P)-dependent oxidoreductase n=1 Tax=Peribacillus frigoritolerans TaxID=450367 RepID=UPI00105A51D1|nr:SDR family oxidoreductase [Peribacillus frigoritolerans]TDL80803.1 SDR family oxidoreductase [Peribacillus frigoritolerans]